VDNPLITPLATLLSERKAQAWSEHQLLSSLVEQGHLQEDYASDNLGLFQAHFLTMNALYRLRRQWQQNGSGWLIISPLLIELKAPSSSEADEQQLQDSDGALEDYYLDWQHFRGASDESVEQLLNSFWTRFLAQDEKQQALQRLDLEEPVTLAEIKQRYRQRVMQYHPDRGGDENQIRELNRAMEVLRRCFYIR
jgi:curved DNA-binding protein CbpA